MARRPDPVPAWKRANQARATAARESHARRRAAEGRSAKQRQQFLKDKAADRLTFVRDRDYDRDQYQERRRYAEGLFNKTMAEARGLASGSYGTGAGGGAFNVPQPNTAALESATQKYAGAGRRQNIKGLQAGLASLRGMDPQQANEARRQLLAGFGQANTANAAGALGQGVQQYGTINAPQYAAQVASNRQGAQNAFAAQQNMLKNQFGLMNAMYRGVG